MGAVLIALDELTVDPGINPRAGGVNAAHAADIAEFLTRNPGRDTPPAVAYRDPADCTHWLSEGFHRHAGYRDAGRTHIPCEVRDGDRTAAALNAAGSNKDHTVLKRTNDDKKLAVKLTIQAAPDWTDEKVATHCGVTHQFVGDVRAAVDLTKKLATVANSEEENSSSGETGKKRGRKTKKTTQAQAAAKLLLEDANQPNEDIAAKVGCTPKTVQVARKALEEAKQIEVVRFRKTSAAPASGSEPVKQDDKKTGDEANEGTPAGASDPFDGPAAKSDPDNPPLDPRFMPHAEEATELAGKFRNWVARLRAVRSEVRKAFPDRDAVVARRIDSFGQFDAHLGELIQTLDENVPECVCPPCCGVGTDAGGVACKFCDGFGAVDRGHHAGLKAYWKKSRARLESLLSSCGGA